MNKSVFGKPLEDVRQHRTIKLVETERGRKYLVSNQNYDTKKFFTETLLAIDMRKTQILIYNSVYLGLPMSDPVKTVMN